MSADSSEQPEHGDEDRVARGSTGHFLAVWFLFGWSLFPLGATLLDAWTRSPSMPVGFSNPDFLLLIPVAGVLCWTAIVGLLWVAGFRPSIRATAAYWFVEGLLSAVLLFSTVGAVSEPEMSLLFDLATVVGTAAVVFSPPGKALQRWVTGVGRDLLRLPPADTECS